MTDQFYRDKSADKEVLEKSEIEKLESEKESGNFCRMLQKKDFLDKFADREMLDELEERGYVKK